MNSRGLNRFSLTAHLSYTRRVADMRASAMFEMGKNGKKTGLGRALMNNKRTVKNSRIREFERIQNADDANGLEIVHQKGTALQSIIETNDYDAFRDRALMEGRSFSAVRGEARLITSDEPISLNYTDPSQVNDRVMKLLRIPYRPNWRMVSPKELPKVEEEAFLKWRSGMAAIEQTDNIELTPFEKSINVWRQLWHVVEKSDVIVQVVDARNPLLYRCKDLEIYTKFTAKRLREYYQQQYEEKNPGSGRTFDYQKQSMLLVNKADLLTLEQRQAWADWFNGQGISFVFFAATVEESDEQADAPMEAAVGPNTAAIVTRTDIIRILHSRRGSVDRPWMDKYPYTVGLVGFPNVGKSSFINSLFTRKRVATGATPGKTQRYQTLLLPVDAETGDADPMVLCDCPGLVFPTISRTREEMVLAGVIQIDRMRNYLTPTKLCLDWFDRETLGKAFKMTFPKPGIDDDPDRKMTPHEALEALARARGFVHHASVADCGRASRILLKEVVNGINLRHCHMPPDSGKVEVQVGAV
ncbi:Large subunit of GTPase [Carpediemonas membranifera]|uniref:Large subunit of GTPase n=1 Tax=Carpediemonas membranifera TaxID=201153 RepID=A0A8J6AQ73_9EUKA|nr:Large subunit of GTPase [Carpediemonas membranifera]|eukprot:KAG9391081.1 Large subunit of GTPase [Carpediemonas membranifera]